MISYAKHDEEFYGIFKLLNGEEILGKAVLTDDDGETLCFIQDPVAVNFITKEIDEGKIARGIGFSKWMQLSDEEFFIIREKDILSVASMSKEVTLMYETYLLDDISDEKKAASKSDINKTIGYLGNIESARSIFEKLYQS